MSNIKIREIKPMGVNLFNDSESYLDELSDSELGLINGGTGFTAGIITKSSVQCAKGVVVVTGATINTARKIAEKIADWFFD